MSAVITPDAIFLPQKCIGCPGLGVRVARDAVARWGLSWMCEVHWESWRRLCEQGPPETQAKDRWWTL